MRLALSLPSKAGQALYLPPKRCRIRTFNRLVEDPLRLQKQVWE